MFCACWRMLGGRCVRSKGLGFPTSWAWISIKVAYIKIENSNHILSFNFAFFTKQILIKRAYFGNVNYFGGPNEISCKSSIALSQAQLSIDTMIVFLSDVWLDSPNVDLFPFTLKRNYLVKNFSTIFLSLFVLKVMERLQTLFIGYSECPPYAFVMFGNFLSEFSGGLRCDELTGSILIKILLHII